MTSGFILDGPLSITTSPSAPNVQYLLGGSNGIEQVSERGGKPGRTFRSQGQADALMAEAAGDAALDPAADDPRNVVLLLQAAFFITGSMKLPRGWVRAAMAALEARGCRAPDASILRWYRSRLVDDPGCFAGVDGVAPELVSDLMDWAHA